MRHVPTTDTLTLVAAEGAATRPGFASAFRELAEARAAYDAAAGRPDEVPTLARAAERLDAARSSMRHLASAA